MGDFSGVHGFIDQGTTFLGGPHLVDDSRGGDFLWHDSTLPTFPGIATMWWVFSVVLVFCTHMKTNREGAGPSYQS